MPKQYADEIRRIIKAANGDAVRAILEEIPKSSWRYVIGEAIASPQVEVDSQLAEDLGAIQVELKN